MSGRRGARAFGLVGALVAGAAVLLASAIPAVAAPPHAGAAAPPPAGAAGSVRLVAARRIAAVGAESQYADVISQIGGRYVRVSAVMRSPTTDPHTFEASPRVARMLAAARLVVQNGLGYDAFMQTIEDAAPSATRKVIVVQRLLRLPSSTRNPHLWYSPRTMPAVARAVERDLAALDPRHRSAFRRNLARFEASLRRWTRAISALRARFKGSPVATTEPVADDLLRAAGLADKTPFSFQEDLMNGVDPAPQDVAAEQRLITRHEVKVLVYNQQVTDTLTASLLVLARRAHIPVVGVYETMPAGYHYRNWMVAEVHALADALAHGVSSPKLAAR